MTTFAPYGCKRSRPRRGRKRPKLRLHPPNDCVVRRIIDMALRGGTNLHIAKALNAEGIPTTNGKRWLKTTIHVVLNNEAYAGTVVWGANAKDGEPPRVLRTSTSSSSPGRNSGATAG